MDGIRLVRPDVAMAAEILAFRREMMEAGSSMDGTGALHEFETAEAWLEDVRLCASWETLPYSDWVAATQLVAAAPDGRVVGMLQIRHSLNDALRRYGGHIGYSVRPSDRRKGYAREMLRQGLDWCRALGFDRVTVSCDRSNEASRRTILANGGEYQDTVTVPEEPEPVERYWITL